MRIPVENFAKDIGAADPSGRLDAPAFHRNKEPLTAVMAELFADRSGLILEIGSGTGQHCRTFADALPEMTFQPTDPIDVHRQSIDAWCAEAAHGNVMPAAHLDAMAAEWRAGEAVLPAAGVAAVLAINVIHIAPWPVAEALFAGAGRHLAPDGRLVMYGPYKRNGAHTTQGNIDFDQALRDRNPEFGVRDIADVMALGRDNGLGLEREIEMPAGNLTLVFERKG